MADKSEFVEQKRDYYLQIMQKAQLLNDRPLINLILKKLARLGMTSAVSTASGCTITLSHFPPFLTHLSSKNMNH